MNKTSLTKNQFLKTKRLTLRPITMSDIPDIFAYTKNPEVSKLLEWDPPKHIDDTKEVVTTWLKNHQRNKSAHWAIVDNESNKVIGSIDIRHYDPKAHRAVIGYCLSQEYWGKGLMTEAVKRIIEYIFSETDITQIAASCRTDNPQSQRVLEKSGFRKESSLPEHQQIKGKWVDLDRWRIEKEDLHG